jgi:hypothetical protein
VLRANMDAVAGGAISAAPIRRLPLPVHAVGIHIRIRTNVGKIRRNLRYLERALNPPPLRQATAQAIFK